MAIGGGYFQKLKQTINSQLQDEEKWAANMRLLRGVGMFAGSIVVMRSFGDKLFSMEN